MCPAPGKTIRTSICFLKWVNHLALQVDSLADVEQAKQKLESAGVEVLGPTDHHFVKSIYFFDPNGIRLELTTRTGAPGYMDEKRASARAECDAWSKEKAEMRRKGALLKVARAGA
jgi:glyoxylase I family protein